METSHSNNVAQFAQLQEHCRKLYIEKNKNYGNSFDKSLDEDGLIVAKIRLADKLNRFSSLIKQDSEGTKDESIIDTLVDMSNYALMTIMWYTQNKEQYETK